MKCGVYGAVVMILMWLGSLAFGQDAVMTLNHKELGVHERPAVEFTHEKHAAKFDCVQCHHDYDKYMNNKAKGDEGQPCASCHGDKSKPQLLPLEDAFHLQCKSCHDTLRIQGVGAGPVMCGQCHVKK